MFSIMEAGISTRKVAWSITPVGLRMTKWIAIAGMRSGKDKASA